jgi:hypothetical protein
LKKIMLLLLAGTMSLSSAQAYAGNPGVAANSCVSERDHGDKIEFVNNCGQDAFVIYCGDLKYTNKKCGDGGHFYTHSFNLAKGASREIDVKGSIRWGSCLGGIGFGRDGFTDSPEGGFTCTKTGR